ncbi:CPBP family intramembrane glutamic endopeptidase [Nonomuraea basaltis]|uniref:CPBP family intramembrane glutamic endopeptidase n=1 Tax=Nonomuraea basaltis TaxID=2495887 RepID=UPI00110C4EC8|nr:type II CAAX endopeptidase family protein [Nonomuraea basaltis]TMR95079.1 CPBP family intramembrane metalloprotease [Nonomuraea basaltis]
MKTLWSVFLAVVVMLAQVFIGAVPALLLLDQANPLREPLGALGITLTGLLLVYLIRRFLYRRPWPALGWRNPSHVLLGVLAGAVPVLAANGLSLAMGASTLGPIDASVYAWLPLGAVVLLLGQAFPEELLWRGHVFDTLSVRLSPRAVVIIVSAGFGVLHIISQSAADTITERLLYVVMAVALGFACTAARVRGGGLWMAVGVHLGFHLGMRVLPLQPVHFSVMLVLQAITLALAGAVLLRGQGLISPDPRASKRVAT